MRMHIGNLSSSTTDDSLRNAFADYGEVAAASVIIDPDTGRPRGFGYVTMPDRAAGSALKALNGHKLDGRTIRVTQARNRTSRGGRRGKNHSRK